MDRCVRYDLLGDGRRRRNVLELHEELGLARLDRCAMFKHVFVHFVAVDPSAVGAFEVADNASAGVTADLAVDGRHLLIFGKGVIGPFGAPDPYGLPGV